MSHQVVLLLINNIRTISLLKTYVFNGSLAEVLTDSELNAAREAMDKAKRAADKRSQIWSAVNHLEAVHARLEKEYKKGAIISWGKYQYAERMRDKDQWVLSLMATCYRALDTYPNLSAVRTIRVPDSASP